jgi:uncharacterized membrane protein YebE (DUF533 family)
MLDPKKLLNDFLGTQVPGTEGTVRQKANEAVDLAKKNPLATGAIVAVLLGTGAGRALTGSALKLGGLAAIGGLAYTAYKNYQAGKAPGESVAGGAEPEILEAPKDSGFAPEDIEQGEVEFALVLVRAMIAAARADGHIDDAERAKIHERLQMSGLNSDVAEFIDNELAKPVDVESFVRAAKSDPQKVELYTASRVAINPDNRAERGYLDMLAGRLGLKDDLVAHIESTVARMV